MSTDSTEPDLALCSEEVSVNTRAFFKAVVSNTDQEERRQASHHAISDERLRCPHDVPLGKDPCHHPNEACVYYSAEKEGKSNEIRGTRRRDQAKTVRLPEPRRSSKWLKMFYVPCNGSLLQFESIYDDYRDCFEPSSPEGSPTEPATPLESPAPKGKQKQEQDDQPQELWLEEEDGQEQQAPKERLQSTKPRQRPTQLTGAPLMPRAEFLKALSETFHGMRVYNPGGRVYSWSPDVIECRACSKYIITGICYRKEPLTLVSTQRQKNRRQLK